MILVVRARELHRDGHVFHRPDGKVWLTDRVPSGYLETDAGDDRLEADHGSGRPAADDGHRRLEGDDGPV